jgi:hypothetical protein
MDIVSPPLLWYPLGAWETIHPHPLKKRWGIHDSSYLKLERIASPFKNGEKDKIFAINIIF